MFIWPWVITSRSELIGSVTRVAVSPSSSQKLFESRKETRRMVATIVNSTTHWAEVERRQENADSTRAALGASGVADGSSIAGGGRFLTSLSARRSSSCEARRRCRNDA